MVSRPSSACTTSYRPTSCGGAPRSPWPGCAISGIATDPVGAGCSGLAGAWAATSHPGAGRAGQTSHAGPTPIGLLPGSRG